MSWIAAVAAVLVALGTGLSDADPGTGTPEPGPLSTLSGEPAPGGDVIVRYWGWMTTDAGIVVDGVGVPGATITMATLDQVDQADPVVVAEDGTWSASLIFALPDGVWPSRVQVVQSVEGAPTSRAEVGLDHFPPGAFEIVNSQGVVRGAYVAGVGTPGDLVVVTAPTWTRFDESDTMPRGWFTIPADGTWLLVLPPEIGVPVFFDDYHDGTWVAGRWSGISSDSAEPYQVDWMTGTRVAWNYVDGASPSAEPVPSQVLVSATPTVYVTVTASPGSAAQIDDLGLDARAWSLPKLVLVAAGILVAGFATMTLLARRRRG